MRLRLSISKAMETYTTINNAITITLITSPWFQRFLVININNTNDNFIHHEKKILEFNQ